MEQRENKEFGVSNFYVLEDDMWRTACKRMREVGRVARMREIMKVYKIFL